MRSLNNLKAIGSRLLMEGISTANHSRHRTIATVPWNLSLSILLLGFSAPVLSRESGGITSQPLPSRDTQAHHDRLFSILPPGETNIAADNPYADERIWKYNELFAEFAKSSFGSGVCVGDYDRDGRRYRRRK